MAVAFASEEMASTCHVEASSGSHVFKVAGYSLTQGMGVAASVNAFTAAGHDWAVVFYPDGHGVNESTDHVSGFVTRATPEVESLGLVHGYCLAVRCMVRVR
ncbi:LOW QUALITY PROTEIN: hypothetical protein SETIT_5G418900v2 [Setaria italica]|uniref:MATH domain-containing protein n=2 Tax=Setaria italica TaxID=4555 RepID=A0A368RES5_SETIT|nr:LOW QUALITY PROTEIN: hypothetical protein SETIT_5G418900v2 [Setaria italica]